METINLNDYGDKPVFKASGHGADIASQRADDLDNMAIERVRPGQLVLDLACGAGGQSFRLADRGADVLAMDMINFHDQFAHYVSPEGIKGRARFFQFNLHNLHDFNLHNPAEIIVCQRAIHYFRFKQAVRILTDMKRLLAPEGRIYLSASGIGSELGTNYMHSGHPIEDRFSVLHPSMVRKHGIESAVCLYSEEEMALLIAMAGLKVEKLFSSPFGNVKAVIWHP